MSNHFHIHGEEFMKYKLHIMHLLIFKACFTMLQAQNTFYIHMQKGRFQMI
jgi:hypothetical protein